jgi:phospholipid/cholesterol/gamma-HCH transport system substrate-binding protein
MENRAYALAAGAFTLVLLAALAAVVVWLAADRTGGLRIDLVAQGAVSGLNARAPVRLRGVDVGTVERIGFDPQDTRRILVRASVDADTPLTRGTYARLSYQGVTGLAYVELNDGGGSREPLRAARSSGAVPRIELKPSRLDEIGDSGQVLLSETAETARRVNLLLSERNIEQLSQTLVNLEGASRKAAALGEALQPTARALPPLVAHVDTLVARTDTLLARTDTLVAHADATVQQLGPVLASVDGLARDMRQHMDVLDRIGRDADRIGDAGETLQRALVGDALPRFQAVMSDVERNSQNLDRLIANLNDQPQSILFGRSAAPPDPGEPGFPPQ